MKCKVKKIGCIIGVKWSVFSLTFKCQKQF